MASGGGPAADPARRARAWLLRLIAPSLYRFRLSPEPPYAWLRQSAPDNCGQTVVSMLTGRTVAEVTRAAGEGGAIGVSQVLRLLEGFGVPAGRPVAGAHAAEFWPVYRQRAGGRRLRGLGFRVSRPGEEYGHVSLLWGREVYDPADGLFRRSDAAAVAAFDWVVLLPG